MIQDLYSSDANNSLSQKDVESSSSSSSSSVNAPRRQLYQTPSVQSDYCFQEARARETANVQKLLGLPLNDKQSLVAKGILTKICRRRPKERTFFLFNDSLVYANVSYGKSLAHPHSFRLEDVSVSSVDDSGIFRNGFIIETPKKSFTVYATIAEEKRRWMQSITQNAETAKHATGPVKKISVLQKSPVWIPNSEATHCMVCLNTEFTLVQRRHHCRNCGKVVCSKCSQYRWVLPSQGAGQLRVCRTCHETLRAEQQQHSEQHSSLANASTSSAPTTSFSSTTSSQPIAPSSQPTERLPAFAPPSWQSHAEETVNSNDSDSDESDIVEDVVVPTCSVKQNP